MDEAEFTAKLLETFKIEAEEHLKNLSKGLSELEKKLPKEKEKEWVESTFREVHSLKGAARSVGLSSIQSICQVIENVFSDWKKQKFTPSQTAFNILYECIDSIANIVSGDKDRVDKGKQALPKLVQDVDLLLKNNVVDSTKNQKEEVIAQSSQDSSAKVVEAPQHTVDNKTIRVSLKKLDKLLQQVEETLMLKLAARRQANDLKNLQKQIELWDKKWAGLQTELYAFKQDFENSTDNFQSKHAILKFFDWQQNFIGSLKDQANQLFKMSSQDYRLAGTVVDGLLDDIKKLLMQPVATLFETFPRMVRDLSQELGKKVEIEFQGGEFEVDKRILEEMKDPLIHLIRNCIDHGIESPSERVKLNKPEQGLILIVASQVSGNLMELVISDDGKGIDLDKVKASAIKQGLITSKDANYLSDSEASNLIFHSGISTSPIITELSGRGLGLGIVIEKVDKLGGHVTVETKKNMCTSFKISLPLTLATFRGIKIKVARQDFILPTYNVKRVLRAKLEDIKTVENREIIFIEGKPLPLISLAALLGISNDKQTEIQDMVYIIILKANEMVMAFVVDEVLNEHEVLIKNLGKQLLRLKNILAATVTEWGQVIPILNPQDLIKSAVKQHMPKITKDTKTDLDANGETVILIAEDSITSRMMLKNVLEVAGFTVKAAVDGAEAFSIFKTEHIDLLLSDVEMPRMDGFTLTEKVRATEKGKNLPIILCTARESQEDKEHGIEIGANAYLEKSSFTQTKLIDVINKLL